MWYSFTVELQFEVLTCNHVLVSLLHISSDTCPSSEGSHVGQKNLGVPYTNRVPSDHQLIFDIVSDIHSVRASIASFTLQQQSTSSPMSTISDSYKDTSTD